MSEDDPVYLLHIRDAINRITAYSPETKELFLDDHKSQDAIIRNLEIIGEAVKNISTGLKALYPDIPWKRIAGMRDKLMHDYFGVDLNLVWNVVETNIPALKHTIESILASLKTDNREETGL